jgi:hypothetical protein
MGRLIAFKAVKPVTFANKHIDVKYVNNQIRLG